MGPTRSGMSLPPNRKCQACAQLAGLFGLLAGCSADPAPPPRAPEPPRARVEGAAPASELSPDEVLFSLKGKQEAVSNCFARAGSSGRGLARLTWVVDEDGRVQRPEVEHSTVAGAELEQCLEEVVGKLHFTKQPSSQSASWTFVRGLGGDAVLERAARREKEAARKSKRRGRGEKGRNDGVSLDKSSPGELDLAAVESVTEHGFRLYAFCMREGLSRDIELNGRVLLNLTVDPDGSVAQVTDAGSDLGDLSVLDCVAEAFYAMRFPEPQGGEARLRYSILLNED